MGARYKHQAAVFKRRSMAGGPTHSIGVATLRTHVLRQSMLHCFPPLHHDVLVEVVVLVVAQVLQDCHPAYQHSQQQV